MNETQTSNEYDKLTPQRKALIDQVMRNLENGDGLWVKGWKMSGVPESAVTGKKYRGINNFYLTIISMLKGYSDNRWATYKQIEDKGWNFKTDEEGKSLGKGAGVSIEFYELRDRETKKKFDRSVLDGMTADERQEYMKDNVYPVRRFYRVFNGDVIDGIPERGKQMLDESGKNARAERILEYWNDNEAPIIYGGDRAFYRASTDEVHLPPRDAFVDMQEFYSTALHEVGHSTGHESRLNRDLSGMFGTPTYAQEELRAEIASMFMEQDLEISVSEKHIENNSRYVKSWHDTIKENPNALFTAITDADKIARYVIEKERMASIEKNTEPYAIVEDTDELNEPTYTVYMVSAYGQTRPAIAYKFSSREALMTEFDKFRQAPFWKDKTFVEVDFDELQEKSIARYKAEQAKEEKAEKRGPEFILPSQVAARALPQAQASDMTGRGAESLTRMSDREIIEKASNTRTGDKFVTLYNGGSIYGKQDSDTRALMSRIAVFSGTDKEQLLRVFRSSGLYRDDTPNALYDKMAQEAIAFVKKLKVTQPLTNSETGSKRRSGINAKT